MRRAAVGMAGTIALVSTATALALAPAEPAQAESPAGCAALIADPAPGYKGPMLHGFACDYRTEAPEVSWTVPAGVSETQFHLYGGDGKEPSYVDPAAREVSTQAPGAPLPPYPGDGRIYASWYEGYVEIPDNRCLVPRLRSRRPAAARRLLFEAGCAVGDVSRRPSRRALRGRVIGQEYRSGTRLSPGAEVGFTLGRRP